VSGFPVDTKERELQNLLRWWPEYEALVIISACVLCQLQVRTIFVSGFPVDTKERELQNLLRWWPGYEACQLTMKADAPLGFALFTTPAMAIAARDALQVL